MIQMTDARRRSTAIAPFRQTVTLDSDGPPAWGTWFNRKFYSLEMVQQPIRARMCGFGDKDRRPLAPAAVARMVVRNEDNSPVDEDDVDCSFFLVTADLWSSDGKHEMNLVLHPTSSDRYITTHAPKRRRTNAPSTSIHPPGDHANPTPSTSSPITPKFASRPTVEAQHTAFPPLIVPLIPGYSSQGYPLPTPPPPPPPPLVQDSTGFHSSLSAYSSASDASSWAYGLQGPSSSSSYSLPSLSRSLSSSLVTGMGTGSSSGPGTTGSWQTDADVDNPYRTWSADPQYGTLDPLGPAPMPASASGSGVESALRQTASGQYPNIETRTNTSWNQVSTSHTTEAYIITPTAAEPPSSASLIAGPHNPPYDQSMYASASYSQRTPRSTHSSSSSSHAQPPPAPSSTIPPLPRHTYTRTLVGLLAANACRLLDEHRKPGIFFLFQDLSIRTEGTFRLRLRLMNIGAPFETGSTGSPRVHTNVSPVLAQTFTAPFVVYSAKRFPGVPGTTALSIAFGNQGQKLPLRNRHGSSKNGRRRRRGDSSDDDSDDGT